MTSFHKEEEPNPSKRCKFFKSTLKHFAFANFHTPLGRLPSPSPDEEVDPISDDDQELFVSAIRSRYMEAKSRRKVSLSMDSFSWALSSTTGESFIAPKKMEEEESDGKEREDFFSVGSGFSRCSSATNIEAFASARTNFSRCSSLSSLDFPDLWRRSIIQDLLYQCKGWPFGLCRKTLLLPPLPKSPAESWSWRKSKSARMTNLPSPIFLNRKASEQPLRAGTKAS